MRCTRSLLSETLPEAGAAPICVEVLVLCSVLLAWVGAATGARLRVPSAECPTIQAAIDMTEPGDDIEVSPGMYNELIDFRGKAVRLHGHQGAEATMISGNGMDGPVVTCAAGETSDTVLEGFTIKGGQAVNGAGMYNAFSSPTVTNCRFIGNSATWGGGMFNSHGSPTITGCVFSNNHAAFSGGAMYNEYSSPTVTNCMFIYNATDSIAGGMYNYDSNSTVTNCMFSGNSAVAGGGGMYNIHGSPIVTNCIFWFNHQDQVYNDSNAVTTYSDIQGGFAGAGNVDADPLLDAAGRLRPGSPCIDAGNTAAVPDTVKTDFDGHDRIRGACVDMGPYESGYGVKQTKR